MSCICHCFPLSPGLSPQAAGGHFQLRPESWALIVTAVVTLLLLYAGFQSGNWRGVLITEIQVVAVGATAWFGLRH